MNAKEITRIVGNIMGVSESDIRQQSRRQRTDRVVFARIASITLCMEKTRSTQSAVAHYYGLKNHATVINAQKSCANMIETNRVYRELYGVIERLLSRSEMEKLQLTDFIPFVYTLDTPGDEQNN